MKTEKIIILTTCYKDGRIPPPIINVVKRLSDKYDITVFYEYQKRLNLKKIYKRRGFLIWLDMVLFKGIFRLFPYIRHMIFGKDDLIEIAESKFGLEDMYKENKFNNLADFRLVNSINDDPDVIGAIEKDVPSIIISIGAPILRKHFLERIYILDVLITNNHIGITPDYMGSTPFYWAFSRKDHEKIGFTIHKIHEKIDYGDYLYQEQVDVSECKNFTDVDILLLMKASTMLAEKIKSGEIFTIKPTPLHVEYKSFPPGGLFTVINAFMNFKKYKSSKVT
ncbi:formyltransferase family protein [candidate division KSB1 bacterium]